MRSEKISVKITLGVCLFFFSSVLLAQTGSKNDTRFYLADLEKMCTSDSSDVVKEMNKKGYHLVERSDYFLFNHQNTSATGYSDASLLLWKPFYPQNRSMGSYDENWQILYSYTDLIHSAALQTAIKKSGRYKEINMPDNKKTGDFFTVRYESKLFIIELEVADETTYKNWSGTSDKSFVLKMKYK